MLLTSRSRHSRATGDLKKKSFEISSGPVVPLEHARSTQSMSIEEHDMQQIHDNLKAYYDVSITRFVDSVCMQAVGHYLLLCPESPLELFSPIFVAGLSPEELEEIAGEAPGVKAQRANLKRDIARLTEANKVLGRA